MVSIPRGVLMVHVSGLGQEREVAGWEEIWSTVACSRPHIIFKTLELVLSGNEFPVIGGQMLDSYLSVTVEITALSGHMVLSKVGDL